MSKRKKYNFIIDKTAALSRYTSRYLKKDETYRSNCFIQILINLPRGNFHKDSFQFYAKKYIKRLQEAPLSSARQSSEFEFIPYEVLLEYVLELCKEWKSSPPPSSFPTHLLLSNNKTIPIFSYLWKQAIR